MDFGTRMNKKTQYFRTQPKSGFLVLFMRGTRSEIFEKEKFLKNP
jgi:hypothetical protein